MYLNLETLFKIFHVSTDLGVRKQHTWVCLNEVVVAVAGVLL